MTLPHCPAAAYIDLREEVADALAEGRPVVALESTVIAHGLPRPRNLAVARKMEAVIRRAGAVPALVAVIAGRIRVGLAAEALGEFAMRADVLKASRRDLGPLLAAGRPGATTVAATLAVAALAGIRLFATGGIGGVHRGGALSGDVSADLAALADSPVAVISSGVKLILDMQKTMEVAESYSIPVIGFKCQTLPAFTCRDSGLPLEVGVESTAEAAEVLRAHWGLGLAGGVLFVNPVPEPAGLKRDDVEGWIATAQGEAAEAGITGKAVTPFLLARLAELSAGRTVEANVALLEDNARVAAEIACAYAAL